MPSYKIHSIKNNKKLSFIMEGENEEKVKQNLSLDGFIVLTIEELQEEKNQIPRFVFEGLKENKNRIEGKVDALDIFSAYEILKNDYQYAILKLYPIDVTDPKEQEIILKNILQIFPESAKKEKEPVKSKTLTEVEVLKKYLEVLTPIVTQSNAENKEILLYDIKRVQMINSVSSIEEVIKKTIRVVYNKAKIEQKKQLYKIILPIAKHLSMVILPPWIFSISIRAQNTFSIAKILFGVPEKKDITKKDVKKTLLSSIKKIQNNDSSEKKIFTNKNIFILLKKQYRSSWLDIFKLEGSYLFIYSLLRQNRPLFWLKRGQEYVGKISLYTCFILVLGIIVIGALFTPEFLFFNGFILLIMGIIFLSLVFFFKEI